MCKVLSVSRSGYYGWLSSPESQRARENRILLERIKQIHGQSRETYGYPRVHAELRRSAFPNQRWVSDYTYIPTAKSWLYLAVLMDLFSVGRCRPSVTSS